MKSLQEILVEVIKPKSMYTELDINRDHVVDFSQADEWHDVIYKSNPDPQRVKDLERWLKDSPTTLIRMYHGTGEEFDIEHQGLLPTTSRRRNSYQSGSGYVYLSIYPGMAEDFARMAFPTKPRALYQVEVPVYMLLPDKDQLANQRHYAERSVGNSLAESIIFGHGARVKGKIPPYFIKRIK